MSISATIVNPLNGFGPAIATRSFESYTATSAHTFTRVFASKYTVVVVVSATYVGDVVKSYTYTFNEIIPLDQVRPINETQFPDVKTKAVSISYSGDKKATKVPAVSAGRKASIEWMSGFFVTVGSSSQKGTNKTTFKPQDVVTRGAMAQFLQKLAGFTDFQLASFYRDQPTQLTDITRYIRTNLPRYYAILWLADTGITVGCNADGTKFCPTNPVNRGAMAEFFASFVGVSITPTSVSAFPDVNSHTTELKYDKTKKSTTVAGLNSRRIGAINWLSTSGITVGSGSVKGVTTYRPQDKVNRGSMAQFLHRIAFKLGATSVRPQ
jgi:hypothetical protein